MSERSSELPVLVAMTGATGAIYGIRLLEVLRGAPGLETHLVMSKPAERTIVEETSWEIAAVKALASVVHPIADIGAPIASGSFPTAGMVVVPCSIRTAAAIAYCNADNLLTRAADVTRKEGRKLVLVVRETPLHKGHLKALVEAADNGATILPPVPAFYAKPTSLDDMVNHTLGRVLDLFGLDSGVVRRWQGTRSTAGEA